MKKDTFLAIRMNSKLKEEMKELMYWRRSTLTAFINEKFREELDKNKEEVACN